MRGQIYVINWEMIQWSLFSQKLSNLGLAHYSIIQFLVIIILCGSNAQIIRGPQNYYVNFYVKLKLKKAERIGENTCNSQRRIL